MAFAIVNKIYETNDGTFIPKCHNELADQTASVSNVDTGIVGLRWFRAKVYVKTFGTLTAADVFTITVQVGTGSSVTNPENIAQANVTVITNDVALEFPLKGDSQVGFQSYNLIISTSSSHSFTADIMVDCA